MAPQAGQSSNQPLGSKELTLFRKIVKHYDQKQYKNGLRYAKMILSNMQYSEHGETLAMKGLLLSCLGKREEAQECVKRGLKADIRSHVCWRVYGLIQRSEKKYDEAMKAYKQALKLDSSNAQILRDLSLLQIQLRDLDGYRDSRYRLLVLQPQQKMAWIGYATAYHLLKDYDMALKIVNEFCNNNSRHGEHDVEHSELVLYQNMILRESGQYQLALEKLEESSTLILDRVQYMELRGELNFKLNNKLKAESIFWDLVERNPENMKYYKAIEQCRDLGTDDLNDRYEIYKTASSKRPWASVPKTAPLYFLRGSEFEGIVVPYLIAGLRKGLPSLFKYLVPVYDDIEKVRFLESTLLEFLKCFEESEISCASLDGNSVPDSPTTLVWLYYLLAQHYDQLEAIKPAFMYIERAIQHTPTLMELYMVKAKILKHSGNFREAARVMEEAQSLDTADRYINSKCAKYMLRAGFMKEAEVVCSKFTREGVNASVNLNEMQCMWYEIECARAFESLGHYGEALKKCHEVNRHFIGIIDDQYDFHSYCIRKTTLTSYIEMLRLEDALRRHKFYYEAAKVAVNIYLRLHDRPNDFLQGAQNGEMGLSSAERKKLRKKQNKERTKDESDSTAKQKQQNQKKPEFDPEGYTPEPFDPEKLLKVEDPLTEASRFIQPLLQLDCEDFDVYSLGFEVYYRKKKVLLMLQCLNKAWKINPEDPRLHVAKAKYLHFYSNVQLNGTIGELVKLLTGELFSVTKSVVEMNESFKYANINSLPHAISVAEVDICLDPESSKDIKSWLIKSLEDEKISGVTLKTVSDLYNGVIRGKYGDWNVNEVLQLKMLCHRRFRSANLFEGGVDDSANCETSDPKSHDQST